MNNLISKEMPVTPLISIRLPTIGEILDYGEHEYYHVVSSLCATPFDIMVQLDDAGINFNDVSEFDVFGMMFRGMTPEMLSMVFAQEIDPSTFVLTRNEENNEPIIKDTKSDIAIDKFIQSQISDTLRKIHLFKKNDKKAGNEPTRKYLIERARKKLERERRKPLVNKLENQIIAMVNTPEFKYDFETVQHLNIYAFNASVRQVQKRIEYSQVMGGYYAGTIDIQKLNMEKLDWLSSSN